MSEFFHDFMNDKATFILTILTTPVLIALVSLGISILKFNEKESKKEETEGR